MRNRHHSALSAILIVLFWLMGLPVAQQPAQPVPSPCASVELRAAMAESRATAERIKSETNTTLITSLKQELAGERGRLSETRQQLGAEQKQSAKLASSYEESQRQVGTLQIEKESLSATITRLAAEREALSQKIARANGRWNCRVLHLGCIGER